MPALIQLENAMMLTVNQLALSSGFLLMISRFFAIWGIFFIIGFFVISLFVNFNFFQVTGKLIFIEGLIAGTLALLFNQIIGFIYFRQRPFVVIEAVDALIGEKSLQKSFPSDHTTIAFALATIIFLWSPKLGVVFLLIATLIAASRIVVGVHYPTDIIGGIVVGVFFGWFIHKLFT